jgi:hypothetical protein
MSGYSHAIAVAVPSNKLLVPQELGNLGVIYRGRKFFVVHSNGFESLIDRMDLPRELRAISNETLQKILTLRNLAVVKIGEGYGLGLNSKQPVGGPL